MKIFYSDVLEVALPQGHRFPMPKYALLRQRVVAAGLVQDADLSLAPAATDEQILRVHSAGYFDKVTQGKLSEREQRRIGFPWSPELVRRARHSVGGTIAACRAALADGLAANLAGGTHHAHPDFGSGFCVFNDVAIAARAMQAEGRARRAVILDCDVHQGDGTAAVFQDDPSVFTFSIHGDRNFPFRKQPGDLDIALPDGCGDPEYLEALERGVKCALERARADLVIYVAGADPFAGDRLGRLALSQAGLASRDRLVLDLCRAAGLPLGIVMGGGYAKDVNDTVAIHLETIRLSVLSHQ